MKDDIEFTFGEHTINLRLGKDPDTGLRKFQCADAKVMSPMQTSDRPIEARIPYLKEVDMIQSTWNGGCGQKYLDDKTRYYDSEGADASVANKIMMGPLIMRESVPTGQGVGDVSLGASGSGYAVNNVLTVVQTGGADCTVTVSSVANGIVTSVTILSGGDHYRVGDMLTCNSNGGRNGLTIQVVSIDGQFWGAVTGIAIITPGTGYSVNDQIYPAGSTLGYELLIKVTGVYSGAVTGITLTTAGTGYTYENGLATTGGAGTGCTINIGGLNSVFNNDGVKCINYKGDLYLAWGRYLYKCDSGTWGSGIDCSHDITDMCIWEDYLILARGLSEPYAYYDGSNVTESNLSTPIKYCQSIVDTLWGSTSNYEVASSTSPLNGGSWSTDTLIGNSDVVITGILKHPDMVVVGTTAMIYTVDADGTVDALDDIFHCYDSSTTGRNMYSHNGFIYVPAGNGGLYEYDSADSIVNRLSPDIYCGNIGEHLGNIMAMAGDDQFLYVALDIENGMEIMRARWEDIGGKASWVWHPVGSITGLSNESDNCKHLYISNLAGSLRLWIVCAHHDDGLYYMHIPTIYTNPALDADFYFNGDATFYTSWYRGENPDTQKYFYRMGIRNVDTTTSSPISVYWRTVEGGSWTLLTLLSTDGYTQANFPEATYGLMIQFKIVMQSSTVFDSSPIIESLTLYFAEYASLQETEQRYTINERCEFRVWGGSDTFWEHADYADTDKAYFSVSVHSFGLDSDNKLFIKYRLSHESFWRTLEQPCNTSPWQTLEFPPNTVGKVIYMDFSLQDAANSQMLTYVINGKLMPNKQKQFSFSCYLASMQGSAEGTLINKNVVATMELLRELDNAKWPVRLRTFAGHDCMVTIDTMHELTMATGAHKSFEYWFTFDCTEQRGV